MMNYFSEYSNVKTIIKYGPPLAHHNLSVVIPTYKKPVSLKRAIESVLTQRNQSLDYNIVIIDNYEGEVSEVVDILKEIYNPLGKEIIYFQNEINIGMHPNWNRTFEIADADYILMLHTDDFLLPHCFDCIEDAISQNISSLYIGRIPQWVSNSRSCDRVLNEIKKQTIEAPHQNYFHTVTFGDVLIGVVPVAPTGFFVSKELFLDSGGYNTKAHTWPADLEFVFYLINNCQLYYCNDSYIVKTEGEANDGTNLKTTVPLLFSIKKVFEKELAHRHVLFKEALLNMRLAKISRGFRIDYDSYLQGLFPKYYLNKYWSIIYSKIFSLQMKRMLNR